MVSNTAGNTWLYALPFFHYYQIMDHGSLLVAGPKYYTPSNLIYYSLDEGVNWYKYVFYSSKVYIWGMYTEPGEKTSILTIYTSRLGFYEWLLFRVDFQNVLGSNCTKDQYFVWSR
ncbi:VPS10 domain-containing protein, partial [Salmonella sp. s54836]|uniref:VPS10 domain-containing protein n=1 Tax=Salmonella sp. s54836 TaxID=3159673 RepID=UPI0039815988